MYKEWNPDTLIVEKKAAGAPLIYELRQTGIPLSEYTPSKGQDKIARVNAVSSLFQGGVVYAPDRRWAKDVIEECNDFPSGVNDDLVDSTTLALLRFRQGGFIRLDTDEPEDDFLYKHRKKAAYY
jgi:predicted phage terminase large subunit-like protein